MFSQKYQLSGKRKGGPYVHEILKERLSSRSDLATQNPVLCPLV